MRKLRMKAFDAEVHGADQTTPRKGRLPTLRFLDKIEDFRSHDEYYSSTDEEDDGFVEGVVYSYDAPGLDYGVEFSLNHVVSQAVEKFETKELANLIKKEYEFVNESDGDEDFELI
jgi:hypothetical protein